LSHRGKRTEDSRGVAARERATIAVILAILILPALRFTTDGWEATTEDELRSPAAFPDLTKPARFSKGFEAFFDDRFGFRRSLIRFHNRVSVELLHTSPVDRVLLGKEGWFYLRLPVHEPGPDGLIRHYQGVKRFTPAKLQAWTRMLRRRSDELRRRGVRYLFVVAPDKHSIYPEYLPDTVSVRSRTALDQLLPSLDEAGVMHVDLRPALRAAKAAGDVYWRTGTHWGDLGAKTVDDEIVRTLRPFFPELNPRPLTSYQVTWSDGAGRGLARMLHLRDRYREPHPDLRAERPAKAARVDGDTVLRTVADDPRLTAVYRNIPWVVFETGDRALPSAVIVNDSFGVALMPYLSEHFERSVFVHRIVTPAQRLALIELEKPDVVIEEIVERNVRGRAETP
jgi:hypothetical protein